MFLTRKTTEPGAKVRSGFTLVELLVTITILGVLAVIVIPTVRVLSRERKVREAARVVGAMFATARDQAAIDGMAGVLIARDSNLPNYGATLYRMRSIPPYLGEVAGDTATVTVTGVTTATAAVTNMSSAANVRAGDFMEFNNNGVLYRLTADPVPPFPSGPTVVALLLSTADPLPPQGVSLPFKIHRQPKRVESSAVTLPNRLFLNLALSGVGASGTGFAGADEIEVIFSRSGAIDVVKHIVYPSYPPPPAGTLPVPPPPVISMAAPSGSVFLMVCTGDGDEIDMTQLDNNNTLPNTRQFLQNPDNLWVVIESRAGNVSVGTMANIETTTGLLVDEMRDVRSQSRTRRSANP